MKIRLAADLQPDSIVDGEGIRTVIWTQGCPHNCKGCHNPGTHDFNGGFLVDVDEVIEELKNLEGQDGITLSGGDPMCQSEACLKICKAAKELGIPKGTLGTWVRKAKEGEIDTGLGTREPEETLNLAQQLQAANKRIKEQEKRIRELEELNEFLEEASAFFAASRRKLGKKNG